MWTGILVQFLERLLLLNILTYGVIFAAHLADWMTLPRLSRLKKGLSAHELSALTLDIVVPARNEGRKIGRCLESLQQQTFTNFQVWMVNDRSTDDTEAVMAHFAQTDRRFHLIEGIDPPPGWVGKVNALMQASVHLSAEWVLFLDADTWLHPENLQHSLTMATQDNLEMLTLIPTFECASFWERVILPTATFLISTRFPGYLVNNPRFPKVAIANGQYLLFQQADYRRLGTHEAVKGSMVEDLDLARLAKKTGLRFRLAGGKDHFRVRMYTRFAELREGWTKNMYFADRFQSEWVAWLQILFTWALALPAVTLPLIYLLPQLHHLIVLNWIAFGLMLLSVIFYRGVFGMNPLYAVFHPLAILIMGWFLWESRRLALSGGVTWKGRRYKASNI